jgi:hypothetical protein
MEEFFLPARKSAPPTTIATTPTIGDHEMECFFLALICNAPTSTTFSLVKKLSPLNKLNAMPITKITIPAFFITEGLIIVFAFSLSKVHDCRLAFIIQMK